MKFKVQEVVRGFQNMSYVIDGKDVQTKVVFVDVSLNEDQGGKGMRTRDIKCVDADVIRSIEHNSFPLVADLEVEELATKNKSELFVRSIVPVPNQKAPSPAPAKV